MVLHMAGNRPVGWTLKEVTIAKLLPNDVPLYAHAKAHGEMELTEEDLAEIAHQQRRKGLDELSLTLSGAKLMEDGAMNALRHLTSKYRLIPR